MKQTQIILRFLFPQRQNAAKTIHPAMRPFRNPATSFETGFSFDRLCFFATGTNMSGITKQSYQFKLILAPSKQVHKLKYLYNKKLEAVDFYKAHFLI